MSSNQPLPSTTENPPKSSSRSRTSSQAQSSTRSFQANLERIDEETNSKSSFPQPTKSDPKHDIQVLTLNDDDNHHHHQQQQLSINAGQDEAPF